MKIDKVVIILILFPACLTACSMKDLSSLKSLDSIPSVGSMKDMRPDVGGIDVAKAASAAKDLGSAVVISDEEIKTMAVGFAKHSDSKNKIAPANSSYAMRLKKLTDKHTKEDGLELNYKVYMTKQVNAFAMADGTVRVYSGLMDLMNDDELLAIIGHEIGHAKLGHSAGRIRLANAASGIRKGVGSTSSLAGALADEGLVGGMVEKVINSQFSQSQETDSDEYGVSFLRKHGYNLDGAVTAFNKLAELDKGSDPSFLEGILSSHPASADRAENLAELIGSDSKVQVTQDFNGKKSEKIVAKVEDTNSEDAIVNPPVAQEASAVNVNNEDIPEVSKKAATTYKVAANEKQSPTNSGWYVQVGAFKDLNAAEMMKSRLQDSGFDVSEQVAEVDYTQYRRVLVGPFGDKNLANANRAKVINDAQVEDSPFIRFVE